jgi:hypothetical protein
MFVLLVVVGNTFIAVFIYSVPFTYTLIVELPYITTKLYHPEGTVSVELTCTLGEEYISIATVPDVFKDISNCLCQELLSFAIYLLPYVPLPVVKLLQREIDQVD